MLWIDLTLIHENFDVKTSNDMSLVGSTVIIKVDELDTWIKRSKQKVDERSQINLNRQRLGLKRRNSIKYSKIDLNQQSPAQDNTKNTTIRQFKIVNQKLDINKLPPCQGTILSVAKGAYNIELNPPYFGLSNSNPITKSKLKDKESETIENGSFWFVEQKEIKGIMQKRDKNNDADTIVEQLFEINKFFQPIFLDANDQECIEFVRYIAKEKLLDWVESTIAKLKSATTNEKHNNEKQDYLMQFYQIMQDLIEKLSFKQLMIHRNIICTKKIENDRKTMATKNKNGNKNKNNSDGKADYNSDNEYENDNKIEKGIELIEMSDSSDNEDEIALNRLLLQNSNSLSNSNSNNNNNNNKKKDDENMNDQESESEELDKHLKDQYESKHMRDIYHRLKKLYDKTTTSKSKTYNIDKLIEKYENKAKLYYFDATKYDCMCPNCNENKDDSNSNDREMKELLEETENKYFDYLSKISSICETVNNCNDSAHFALCILELFENVC